MFQGWKDSLHGYWGESRAEESRPSGQEPDHLGPRGPVRTVALLCSGKERPGKPWDGFVWDLVPVLTAMWKQRLPARC